MQTFSNSIRWWFEAMDNARRRQGAALDRAGLGPMETPSHVVLQRPGAQLRYYGGRAATDRLALIVPAPIKRHYIWDVSPEHSVVQQLLNEGMHTYLVEWTEADNDFGLEEYVHELLAECVNTVHSLHPGGRIFLLSHSLGGVFATIYATLAPERIAGVVLLEAPLHFGRDAGSFAPLVRLSPQAERITRHFSKVPGSVLNLASMLASPTTFGVERYADLVASLGSTGAMRMHMLVERWTLDEAPMSSRLFEQVVEQLYRHDLLMRGKLEVAGRRIGPRQFVSPVLAVFDPRSLVIPPASIIAFHDAAASREKRLLAYHGDKGVGLAHVGVLVGDNAHRHLWPEILSWITEMEALPH